MKIGSIAIETNGEETQEINKSFSDFEATEGILFPTTFTLSVGEMVFNGKLLSSELNGDVSLDGYK